MGNESTERYLNGKPFITTENGIVFLSPSVGAKRPFEAKQEAPVTSPYPPGIVSMNEVDTVLWRIQEATRKAEEGA